MSNPNIEANIHEIESGIYYRIKLFAIPRVGELIELYSFVEHLDRKPPKKFYEVVQVVHNIHDVSERVSQSLDGAHFVNIFVKSTTSEFFK